MPSAAIAELRTARAVRERAHRVLAAARQGRATHFSVDDSRLRHAAALVVEVTNERYPDGRIPYHSRWRHFEAGGIDRRIELERALEGGGADVAQRARAEIDLALVSVLLDAGAGPAWSYREAESGRRFDRSEGLGVASFRAFMAGAFSSDPARPLQVDATGLAVLDAATLGRWFQAGPDRPLVGLDGRVRLLHRLARALLAQPQVFGEPARPGRLFDVLSACGTVRAASILGVLLDRFSSIWPSGSQLDGEPLGDVWRHPAAGGEGVSAGWLPLHKLSQWLTYSLLEPFERAGAAVVGLDALTGLAEYRNGGLLLDTGVLVIRDPRTFGVPLLPAAEPVVEWRALTVALIDELADLVRSRLGREASDLPLAAILEGGTWAAGRRTAAELRGGLPPFAVLSDGTVF